MKAFRLGFVIALFLLFLVGAVYLSSRSRLTQKTERSPTPTARPVADITPATFPKLESVDKKTTYNASSLVGSLPTTVAAYRVLSSFAVLEKARRVARVLGFSSEPQTIDIPGEPLYAWDEGEKTFSAGGSPPAIAYLSGLPKNLPSVSVSVEVLKRSARSFLEDNALVPAGTAAENINTAYLAPVGNDPVQTTRDRATVVQLDYRLFLGGIPVLSGYPDIPTYTFWFDGAGAMRKFSGLLFPPVEVAGEIQILSLSEAKARLESGGGTILSAFSQADKNRVETQYYSFKTTRVTDASQAYYFTPGQEVLAPVYVFTGTATDERTKKTVNTITLVSALP